MRVLVDFEIKATISWIKQKMQKISLFFKREISGNFRSIFEIFFLNPNLMRWGCLKTWSNLKLVGAPWNGEVSKCAKKIYKNCYHAAAWSKKRQIFPQWNLSFQFMEACITKNGKLAPRTRPFGPRSLRSKNI